MPRKKQKPKNPAAAALGALRWKNVNAKERTEELTHLIRKRWLNATDEERAAQGALMAAGRAKAKKLKAKQ